MSDERGLIDGLDAAWGILVVATGLTLAAWAVWSVVRATPSARRAQLPVLAPAVVVGLAEAAYAAALLAGPVEDPSRDGYAAIFLGRAVAALALAAGVAWTVVHEHRTRRALARLGAELLVEL